jgi:hypothetical protein
MIRRKQTEKGFALVTALVMSAVVLVAGGVLVYQVSGGNRTVVRDTKVREAVRVAEEGLAAYVNYIYKANNPNTNTNLTPQQIMDGNRFLLTAQKAALIPGYISSNVGGGGAQANNNSSNNASSNNNDSSNNNSSNSVSSNNNDSSNNVQSTNNDKVTICHNGNTLEIAASGLNGHIPNHAGDTMGACPASPPAGNPPSVSGYGVKVVSWSEVKTQANGYLFRAQGGNEYELATELVRTSVGAASGVDANAIVLNVTAYAGKKSDPNSARWSKNFRAVLHRQFPAQTVSNPAPTPTPVATANPCNGNNGGANNTGSNGNSGSNGSSNANSDSGSGNNGGSNNTGSTGCGNGNNNSSNNASSNNNDSSNNNSSNNASSNNNDSSNN